MLEYQMQQEEEEKEIENLKIAVREIQNLIWDIPVLYRKKIRFFLRYSSVLEYN